jgi:hypothetical protein
MLSIEATGAGSVAGLSAVVQAVASTSAATRIRRGATSRHPSGAFLVHESGQDCS